MNIFTIIYFPTEVFLATFLMPLIFPGDLKMVDVGVITMENMGAIRKTVLEQPELKQAIMKLVPVFLNKGFLE